MIGLKVAGLSEIRAAGEEKWRVRLAFLYVVGVEELLLATPHSNLGQSLCTCLVGWYPPSRGDRKHAVACYLVPPISEYKGGGQRILSITACTSGFEPLFSLRLQCTPPLSLPPSRGARRDTPARPPPAPAAPAPSACLRLVLSRLRYVGWEERVRGK